MRFIVRLAGFLCAVGGFIALVVDMTRLIANGTWTPAPLASVLNGVSAGAADRLLGTVSGFAPWVTLPFTNWALAVPACIAGLVLGFALMLLGRGKAADELSGF